MKSLLLLGAGGHYRAVLDTVLGLGAFDKIGLVVNDGNFEGNNPPIVGNDNDLDKLFALGWRSAFITVGSVGDTRVREQLYNRLNKIGFDVPNIIDKTAVIAASVQIEKGCYIGKRAVLNAACSVGECAIVNTGAIIEHDCKIGKFCHIATGAVLCGNVGVGDYTHIGAGSTIKQGVIIGERTLIGMGSVVLRNFGNDIIAYGNPCNRGK